MMPREPGVKLGCAAPVVGIRHGASHIARQRGGLPPGGESYADADLRAAQALEQVAAHPARRPLIVSHDMIGRMLQRNLLNLDPAEALAGRHPHDVVYAIDYRSDAPTHAVNSTVLTEAHQPDP